MSAGLLFLLLCRTSTASSRSQGSVPDPNGKPKIRAVPAGPQLQARDRSRPRRTGAASPRSERSLPDFNWLLQALDRSGPRRTRTATFGPKWPRPDLNCEREIAVVPAGPEQLDRSGPRRTRTATSGSKLSPPDFDQMFLHDSVWLIKYEPTTGARWNEMNWWVSWASVSQKILLKTNNAVSLTMGLVAEGLP